ncbi:hypothetical protein F4778DRAFT_144731 [Xylariomycetidae sp. FL2044]|nr:hypothetical protein F4778DRAFT_144731 [Xylariomycetidae sp. FL2044]
MTLSKHRISSPLEAGRSLLDTQSLPPHLHDALEYASKRLARKALHITLVVVRNEYQLPASVPPCATPTSPPATPDHAAATAGLASPPTTTTRFTSPMAAGRLRQLVRRGTASSLASSSSSTTSASDVSAPSSSRSLTFPLSATSTTTNTTATEPLTSPRRWIWPPTPGSPPYTPMTPHTPSSIITSTTTTASSSYSAAAAAAQGPNTFGIRLIHAHPLPPKAEKTLRTTIAKAERKFRIGGGWLFPPLSPTAASACGLNTDLVRRSILQNEVLFSTEGLTLLALDRLYCFKAALAAYSRSLSSSSSSSSSSSCASTVTAAVAGGTTGGMNTSRVVLEDAVDALRRLVLFNGGRPVARADLHRSYDFLGVVGARALEDVERMYRRAYGGVGRVGAFIDIEERGQEQEQEEGEGGAGGDWSFSRRMETMMMMRRRRRTTRRNRGEEEEEKEKVVKIGTPPPPRGAAAAAAAPPVLRLDTGLAIAVKGKTASPAVIIRPRPTTRGGAESTHPAQPKERIESNATEKSSPTSRRSPLRRGLEIRIEKEIEVSASSSSSVRSTTPINDDNDDDADENDEENEGDRTARPIARGYVPFWQQQQQQQHNHNSSSSIIMGATGISIDEMMLLSPCDTVRGSNGRADGGGGDLLIYGLLGGGCCSYCGDGDDGGIGIWI